MRFLMRDGVPLSGPSAGSMPSLSTGALGRNAPTPVMKGFFMVAGPILLAPGRTAFSGELKVPRVDPRGALETLDVGVDRPFDERVEEQPHQGGEGHEDEDGEDEIEKEEEDRGPAHEPARAPRRLDHVGPRAERKTTEQLGKDEPGLDLDGAQPAQDRSRLVPFERGLRARDRGPEARETLDLLLGYARGRKSHETVPPAGEHP